MTRALFAYVLASAFLISAIAKVRAPRLTIAGLADYRLLRPLPRGVQTALFLALVAIEFVASLALLVPRTQTFGLVVAVLLGASFVLSVTTDDRQSYTNCGCGVTESTVDKPSWSLVLRAAVIMAIAGLALVLAPQTMTMAIAMTLVVMSLPFAITVLSIPLISHVWEVQRRNLPERVRRATAT